ncbi:MAG: M23 family metallopeptidase [Thermodesulfovibrio sp.]|nr:M23 family metallopeptidase [Thermodesulfovibrio sp.]MDW7999022.1 M23 family metallopeptidase [Thermodesulfovibrio sp.]
MIERVNTQTLNNFTEKAELSKKIETIFLTELIKVLLANTSFSEGKTTSTYMTAVIPQIAEMFSEREIGIGKFLTENPNFLASITKNQKIELKPSSDNQEQNQKPILPKKISLPVSGKITSYFGLRTDPIDGKLRHHNGIDIAVPEGTEIKSIFSGKVVYSGYSETYGNCVIVEHDNGLQTVYAHNSKNLVKKGDRVSPDTVIALSGSTGRTTGPHLHFEVRKDGKPLNPLIALKDSQKATII